VYSRGQKGFDRSTVKESSTQEKGLRFAVVRGGGVPVMANIVFFFAKVWMEVRSCVHRSACCRSWHALSRTGEISPDRPTNLLHSPEAWEVGGRCAAGRRSSAVAGCGHAGAGAGQAGAGMHWSPVSGLAHIDAPTHTHPELANAARLAYIEADRALVGFKSRIKQQQARARSDRRRLQHSFLPGGPSGSGGGRGPAETAEGCRMHSTRGERASSSGASLRGVQVTILARTHRDLFKFS